jgi:hypothetical protein
MTTRLVGPSAPSEAVLARKPPKRGRHHGATPQCPGQRSSSQAHQPRQRHNRVAVHACIRTHTAWQRTPEPTIHRWPHPHVCQITCRLPFGCSIPLPRAVSPARERVARTGETLTPCVGRPTLTSAATGARSFPVKTSARPATRGDPCQVRRGVAGSIVELLSWRPQRRQLEITDDLESGPPGSTEPAKSAIFIVRGRDEGRKALVARFIANLTGRGPIVPA